MSDERKKMVSARYREAGKSIDEMRKIFERVQASDFLTGKVLSRGKAFYADFEWIMRPTNFEKIRNGKYDNRIQGKPKDDDPYSWDFLKDAEG
jgi:hypothetical protein